jgi:hypothetical protein
MISPELFLKKYTPGAVGIACGLLEIMVYNFIQKSAINQDSGFFVFLRVFSGYEK